MSFAVVVKNTGEKYKLKIARGGSHCEGSNLWVAVDDRVDCLQPVQWNLVLRPPRKVFAPLLRSYVSQSEASVRLRNFYNSCSQLAIVGTY